MTKGPVPLAVQGQDTWGPLGADLGPPFSDGLGQSPKEERPAQCGDSATSGKGGGKRLQEEMFDLLKVTL